MGNTVTEQSQGLRILRSLAIWFFPTPGVKTIVLPAIFSPSPLSPCLSVFKGYSWAMWTCFSRHLLSNHLLFESSSIPFSRCIQTTGAVNSRSTWTMNAGSISSDSLAFNERGAIADCVNRRLVNILFGHTVQSYCWWKILSTTQTLWIHRNSEHHARRP